MSSTPIVCVAMKTEGISDCTAACDPGGSETPHPTDFIVAACPR